MTVREHVFNSLYFIWYTDEMQGQMVVNDNNICYIGNMLFLYKFLDLYSMW